VTKIVDNLFKLGAHVIYGSGNTSGMHVSGHGHQGDLKLMLTLMKPKYFMPIHGEYRMLHLHKMFADSVGVEQENVFILNNGDVVDIKASVARHTRSIPAGSTYVDGLSVGDMDFVLRDRQKIAEEGILMITVLVNQKDGKVMAEPEVISRGFAIEPKRREQMNRLILDTLKDLYEAGRHSRNVKKKQI